MDLRLRLRAQNDVTFLDVSGEIDLHSEPQLRAELVKAAEGTVPNIVVDLSDVNFIDSTGIGALVAGLKRARAKGAKLAFCGVQPRVHRALEITGLLQALPLFKDKEAAIAGLSGSSENVSQVVEAGDGR